MQSRLVYPLSVYRIGNIRPSQFEIFERTFARGIGVLQFTCRHEETKCVGWRADRRPYLISKSNACMGSFEWGMAGEAGRNDESQEVLTRKQADEFKLLIYKFKMVSGKADGHAFVVEV